MNATISKQIYLKTLRDAKKTVIRGPETINGQEPGPRDVRDRAQWKTFTVRFKIERINALSNNIQFIIRTINILFIMII